MTGTPARTAAAPRAKRDERYERLVELAPDGIVIHEAGVVTFANAAAMRMAGAQDCSDLVGSPIERLLDPPYLKAVEGQLAEDAGTAEPSLPVRDVLHRLDGTDLQVEVRAVAFVEHGRPSAHLVIRDITERLEAQQSASQATESLHEAQRMELVGALAGGVAHEVSNMMQVVLGASELLSHDVRMPKDCLADVQLITRAAECAAVLTRQLLAFSRRSVHRPEVVDLDAALLGAESTLRRLLTDGQRLVLTAGTGLRVRVDPGQLQQVIINLALNARDAMPVGGTLTIRAAPSRLSEPCMAAGGEMMPPGDYAVILVHDSGAGMEDDIQARIFEPFFTTKPAGQGTGLGLAATHGVLGQNGGFITVVSSPGLGSTFSVYLPALGAGAVVSRHDDVAVGSGATLRGVTILIVDDEPAVRKIAARVLERGGSIVQQAAGGTEALALIERNGPPQLLLTDLRMPGMGGGELARQVRLRWPSVPILFMSGYAIEELRDEGAISNVDDLLQKPFTSAAMLTTVYAALKRRPSLGSPQLVR